MQTIKQTSRNWSLQHKKRQCLSNRKVSNRNLCTKEGNNQANLIRQNQTKKKTKPKKKKKRWVKTKQTPQTNQAVKTLIHQKQINLTN